jgi:predicted aldo/keto reductase-like oxidoreductase
MVYRRLGRTDLWISEIALGGSPLPDDRLLYSLLDRGVNYIDMSDSYENGNAERKTGRAVKKFGRDKIHVHARFHLTGPWTEASIIASVEGSMRRLAMDDVDILGIHGVEKPEHLADDRVLGAFEKLKTRGLYRFRGVTCHLNQRTVIPKAVESGLYDMVQIGYNVFDILETEKNVQTYGDYLGESGIRNLIGLCRTRDIGVTAMKVLKIGGRRQALTAEQTAGGLFPAMLKWALETDGVAARQRRRRHRWRHRPGPRAHQHPRHDPLPAVAALARDQHRPAGPGPGAVPNRQRALGTRAGLSHDRL